MLVSLYTTRVVLNTLGVEDYGIYNVVGGFVGMFNILTSSLSAAISRFITFGLGKRDLEKLQRIYSTAIIIQVAMAIIVGLLIEGVGIWYLHNKINIPAGRLNAAFWVLHCSVITFGLGLLSVPYNAEIVAHEKMDTYAYFSILDATLALAIVFILKKVPFDKLILYAALCMGASLLMRFLYALYCRKHFEECRFKLAFEKDLLKEMGSFAGWNFLTQFVWIVNTVGASLLVNSFFGVACNAAIGVANQVQGAVKKLAGNFIAAINPQITKTYAEGDLSSMHSLIFRGTRLYSYLLLIIAIPAFLEMPLLLDLWLKNVPEKAILFARMAVIATFVNAIGGPLVTAQLATGNIKRYQIVMFSCGIWVIPLTFLAYKFGHPVEWYYYIFIFVYLIVLFVRIPLVKNHLQLPWKEYCLDVLLRVAVVAILGILVPLAIHNSLEESLIRLALVLVLGSLAFGLIVWLVGIKPEERHFAQDFIKQRIKTLFK